MSHRLNSLGWESEIGIVSEVLAELAPWKTSMSSSLDRRSEHRRIGCWRGFTMARVHSYGKGRVGVGLMAASWELHVRRAPLGRHVPRGAAPPCDAL